MNRINTRWRIIIVTSLTAITYFFTQGLPISASLGINLNLNFDPLRHVLLGLIVYLGTYWALFFKIKGERFITILLFPALALMAGSFFTELLVNYVFPVGISQFTFQLFATILVGLLTYITILTVNILNAAYLNNIPLGQAARAAYFVLSLMITFIIYFILLSNDIFILYKAVIFFVITFVIVNMCLWSIGQAVKQRFSVALTIGLLLTLGQTLLIAWPINPTYLSLILDLIFYFTLNIAMEIREKLSRWIWLEYTLLFLVIISILLIIGEWGINGSFI